MNAETASAIHRDDDGGLMYPSWPGSGRCNALQKSMMLRPFWTRAGADWGEEGLAAPTGT